MHAIQITEHGGPEVMKWTELPTPSPDKGEALVRVEAAGVNFIDIYFRKGLYRTPLPGVLGVEGAGIVETLGPEVTTLRVGTARILPTTSRRGTSSRFARGTCSARSSRAPSSSVSAPGFRCVTQRTPTARSRSAQRRARWS